MNSHDFTSTCFWLAKTKTGCTYWPLATAYLSLPSFLYFQVVISTFKEPICPICWINSIPNEQAGVIFSTEIGLFWVYFLMLLVVGHNLNSFLIFQKISYAQECCIVELIIKSMFPRCLERQISDILVYLCNPFCLAFIFSSTELHFLDLSPVFLVALLFSFLSEKLGWKWLCLPLWFTQ